MKSSLSKGNSKGDGGCFGYPRPYKWVLRQSDSKIIWKMDSKVGKQPDTN